MEIIKVKENVLFWYNYLEYIRENTDVSITCDENISGIHF